MTDVCCFGAVHRYPKPKYTGKVITELFICNFTFYLGREVCDWSVIYLIFVYYTYAPEGRGNLQSIKR